MNARLSSETMARVATYGSATLHEAAGRIGALPSAIKPIAPGFRISGPVMTVASAPGDNLWIHRALDVAGPGDVLVVHTSGGYEWGYWGEVMSSAALQRRIGGLVIDACVRDGAQLARLGLPVFARGLCVRGTAKDAAAPGAINQVLHFGDVTVSPGDLVVGDGDGVVVIPQALVDQTIAAAVAREAHEARILERLEAGERTLDIYGWR